MDRAWKTARQRAGLTKVQSCFGDFVQGLFKSLPALPSKVLAELRFYRDNLLFDAVERGVDVASPEQLGKKKGIKLHVRYRQEVILTDAGGLFDQAQQSLVIPITRNEAGKTRGGAKLVVVGTLLEIERFPGVALYEL